MPQLSTGLVIAGAYADKVRRVLFAQLRDEVKSGKLTPQKVAQKAGELNRLLYEILVNKLKVDKGDVVRIRVEYVVEDNDIRWLLDTLSVEVFRRVPDEEVAKVVRETVARAKQVLEAPVTAAEAEWTGEKPTVTEAPPSPPSVKIPVEVTEAVELGETTRGERLVILKDAQGNNVGLAILAPEEEEKTKLLALIIGTDKSYKAETTLDKPVNEVDADTVLSTVKELSYMEAEKQEVENIIREKMLDLK